MMHVGLPTGVDWTAILTLPFHPGQWYNRSEAIARCPVRGGSPRRVPHDSRRRRVAGRAASHLRTARAGPRHAEGGEGRAAAERAVGGRPRGVPQPEDPRVAAADGPQTLAGYR